MHTGNELEAQEVEKGRSSCDSDAPQVGSARSDSTRVVKVNSRKMNRRKTRPYYIYIYIFSLWRCGPAWVMASSFLRFLGHTQRRITVGRTPLDEWSARRRDLYLTTHNTQHRQTSMPRVGFEPTISAGERPKTFALDRAATGTGYIYIYIYIYI